MRVLVVSLLVLGSALAAVVATRWEDGETLLAPKRGLQAVGLVVTPISPPGGGAAEDEAASEEEAATEEEATGGEQAAAYPAVSEEELWESLLRLEGYIRQLEDPQWGYIRDVGYPLYLYSFGALYLNLWLRFDGPHYLEEMERTLEFIRAVREEDGTWRLYTNDTRHVIYNALFAQLFLDAWQATDNEAYRQWAKEAIASMAHEEMFDAKEKAFFYYDGQGGKYYNYNYNFYAFSAIAYYYGATGEPMPREVRRLARWAYNYARSGLDKKSGRWYYDDFDLANKHYSGHSALYQLFQLEVFFDYAPFIQKTFPDIYSELMGQLPIMAVAILSQVEEDGSFLIDDEHVGNISYTEDLGTTIRGLYLLGQVLGIDTQDHIRAAERTLLSRQREDGSFYKSQFPEYGEEIFYEDNIAVELSRYLRQRGSVGVGRAD